MLTGIFVRCDKQGRWAQFLHGLLEGAVGQRTQRTSKIIDPQNFTSTKLFFVMPFNLRNLSELPQCSCYTSAMVFPDRSKPFLSIIVFLLA